jgi:hypothetical protein
MTKLRDTAMAGTKRYGADGPPQLVGKCQPVSPNERLGWFRRVRRLTSRPGAWVRRVVCGCGREDDFRVLITHPFKPLFSRYGIDLGAVHLELACHSCSSELVVPDKRLERGDRRREVFASTGLHEAREGQPADRLVPLWLQTFRLSCVVLLLRGTRRPSPNPRIGTKPSAGSLPG